MMTDFSTKAVYVPQLIAEYKGNPFIEALPPILSATQAIDAITAMPDYNADERELNAHYRFHCVQRLFRYFQPLDTHIDICLSALNSKRFFPSKRTFYSPPPSAGGNRKESRFCSFLC